MLARRRLCAHGIALRRFHDVRTYKEDKRWPGWQVVVGIETHAQIKSRRKLFSESSTVSSNDQPNVNVSLFDASLPGTLPKINPRCVDLALRTAIALDCDISQRSSFDRKHYFYGDLPAGYQITQQYSPIATKGQLRIQNSEGDTVPVRIKQIQLEQDTAKSTFQPRTSTLHVDLNRAGVGLMEIVSEPDMRSPEEAGIYVRTLQSILRAMGSSDGNMEQGSLRCDINVSVNRQGEPPGTRCEVKNVNSVKFMIAAIIHEVHRQKEFIEANPGCPVPQETRGFDENTFETFRLRSKEDAPDYRYMPDPNLGTLALSKDRIESIRSSLPPLPWEVRANLILKYPELEKKQQSLNVLLSVNGGQDVGLDGEPSNSAVNYFETVCQGQSISKVGVKRDPGLVLNWLTHELLGQLAARRESFSDNTISSEQFGELIDLVQSGTITGTSGKVLLKKLLSDPASGAVRSIAQSLDLIALSPSTSGAPDTPSSGKPFEELQKLCQAAISDLPQEAAAFRSGRKNVLNKLVGHVMRNSRGRADAGSVKQHLEDIINSTS